MHHTYRFLAIGLIYLLGGCSFWAADRVATRMSIQLGEPLPVAGRSARLPQQIIAMDREAFDGQRTQVHLKLSYQLSQVPPTI